MIILDVECYSNYFLVAFKQLETGLTKSFEMYEGRPLNKAAVAGTLSKNTTISFNGLGYDLYMIRAALDKFDNQQLKKLSDAVIKSNKPAWTIFRDNKVAIDLTRWDHIDIMNIAIGQASLKIYGGRLHAAKMQDLPFNENKVLTREEMEIVRKYCINDLELTEALFNHLKPAIDLRIAMSSQYNLDLRSKSDAQIAEAIIKQKMTEITGKTYRSPSQKFLDAISTVPYLDPGIVEFKSPGLKGLFNRIVNHTFETRANGSILLPDFLKDQQIRIGQTVYQMGIGGLHSCEKSQYLTNEKLALADFDVASFYPAIILQQRLAPTMLGSEFLELYGDIVSRRLEAKATGDKVTADTLKIVLNASFGKLGSKYSPLYSPQLLLQVTLTGQLSLLMLIERLEYAGIRIMSANTDGIVCHFHPSMENTLKRIIWDWELDTSFTLERSDYKVLASRDVNNYFAIKANGGVKGKGCFAGGSLSKNPARNIIYTAVVKFVAEKIPLEDTVRNCKDVRQFITVRRVQGGAVFDGVEIGKAVRFYSSNAAGPPGSECLYYKLNGNRVAGSMGCRPLMLIDDDWTVPKDLDYESYIQDAKDLLTDVGYRG